MARLGAKVMMKALGRGRKLPQHNIVDLFPDIPTVPDEVFTVNGREAHTQESIKWH